MTHIGLIWAQAKNGVIGRDNAIPWHIPEDMAHFRKVTGGHPVVMGRRTWDSLPERFRPLPGRRNIVITRQPDWSAAGAEHTDSLEQALRTSGPDPLWVLGGGEIYRAAMQYATELMVTEVDAEFDGDAYAPVIGPDWVVRDGPWEQSRTGLRYRVRHYTRRPGPTIATEHRIAI